MRGMILFFLLLMHQTDSRAQFHDDFSDGNYTDNPVWHADSGNWIINPLFQLQSDHGLANSQFQIVTRSRLALQASWEWQMRLDFNTSSVNYAEVFLTATDSVLTGLPNDGYVVRIGNTTDEISLYRKTGNTYFKLIDGTDGVTNQSINHLRIRVTRDTEHRWSLYRDNNGSGLYYKEGTATDSSILRSDFFGIVIRQSTLNSFARRHYFDSFVIKNHIPDTIAPEVLSIGATDSNQVILILNEAVEQSTAADTGNYSIGHHQQAPLRAIADPADARKILLQLQASLPDNEPVPVFIRGIRDMAWNRMRDTLLTVRYYRPKFGDVVIHEIMADPVPAMGLPELEWVELKNNSQAPVSLEGWRFGDGSAVSSVFPAVVLQPEEILILCGSSTGATLFPNSRVLRIAGFPSINNEGDELYLLDATGKLIHTVNFHADWYGNAVKRQGGWTLEMIDAGRPCLGAVNWLASVDPAGGTPGRTNSVMSVTDDHTLPRPVRAFAADSLHLHIVINKTLDRSAVTDPQLYSISDGIGHPASVSIASFAGDQVVLQLEQPLSRGIIYAISIKGLTDCSGNLQSGNIILKTGLTEAAAHRDVIINEVLFNPPFDGADYVELYNRSGKILDLGDMYIANRNTLGEISQWIPGSAGTWSLLPGEFAVLSGNIPWIIRQYNPLRPEALIPIRSMPSLPDDKGTVVLLNRQGLVVDELSYSHNWHFPLINNPEGVALERISYEAPTQHAGNWHSGAGPLYGTPAARNAQSPEETEQSGTWDITPRVITPDNDGREDFATIHYHFPSPGYTANIIIFDAAGKPVRQLQRNALCGITGSFRWDGLGDHYRQLATGIYVVWAEVFNLEGQVHRYKKAVVISRR